MRNYLNELSMHLIDAGIPTEETKKIMDIATMLSVDFEITEKQTAIVPYVEEDNTKMVKIFISTKLLEGKSQKSMAQYKTRLGLFFQAIPKSYKDITKDDIKMHLAYYAREGRTAAYVDNIRSIIGSFFNWLADEDYIVKSPSKAVKPIKKAETIPEPFSQLDLDSIRSACDNVKKRMIVEMLLSSGVRVDEFVSLDKSDIEFERRRIHVRHGKGNKERYTYFSPIAEKYLKAYLETRKDNNECLVVNNKYERISAHGVEYLVRELGKTAGVKKAHPHRFRRTLATTLARRKMPIQQIKELLGHNDISITMRYIRVTQEDVANAYAMCA